MGEEDKRRVLRMVEQKAASSSLISQSNFTSHGLPYLGLLSMEKHKLLSG